MSNYSLKIILGGIEMAFTTRDISAVKTQLDEYFDLFIGKRADLSSDVTENEPVDDTEKAIEIFGSSIQDTEAEPEPSKHISEDLPLTLFMERKVSNSLFDDFIITAFFLKNILNQESFTIKSLNTNLYTAANKLVDFHVLNDVLKSGYIKVVENVDSAEPTRYIITPAGEGYYNTLQDI